MNAFILHQHQRFFLAALMRVALLCGGLTAGVGWAGEMFEPNEESSAADVQIQLGEWSNDLPPGTSLIVPGGAFINNGFPALSADRKRIALLYHAGHPLVEGYPTLDIYLTSTLVLQRRIEFIPKPDPALDPSPRSPEVLKQIRLRLIEVNRNLAQGGFRPIPLLFDFTKQKLYAPIENLDKRIAFTARGEISVLTITSLLTKRVELEMEMPTIPVFQDSSDPDNDCVVQGGVLQGWYDKNQKVYVLRMHLGGGRDGCELPEQWLLKRQR